jgi:hypothetical protein
MENFVGAVPIIVMQDVVFHPDLSLLQRGAVEQMAPCLFSRGVLGRTNLTVA